MPMKSQLEQNLYESFSRVKSDVVQLSNELHKISNALSKSIESQDKLKQANVAVSKNIDSMQDSIEMIDENQNSALQKNNSNESALRVLGLGMKKASAKIEKLEMELKKLKQKKPSKPTKKKSKKTKQTKKKVSKIVVAKKHKPKAYVASKTGKKFHVKNCIFAKNIKPKSMIKFSTKEAYLNKGYRPCYCINKI